MDTSLTIIAPTIFHTHTVLFLHGQGDTAPNCAATLQSSKDSKNRSLPDAFPSFRWVFPQSELQECAASPGDRIPQWFDICNVTDFSDNEDLQAIGLRESVESILRLLEKEAEKLGYQWDRIVLAGINQGAAIGIHTLLNLDLRPTREGPRRLGACLGFSCRMPFPGRSLADARNILKLEGTANDEDIIRHTPVLLEHCVNDRLVLPEHGRNLRDTLKVFGAHVTWKEYSNGGHWFNSPTGVDDAEEFLNSCVFTIR